MEQVYKQPKSRGFTKTRRPELFPVKDEHKNPCSYLDTKASKLNKKSATL